VIASRAVNRPSRTLDAVWMTCSTATRTTRHYEAAAGVRADERSSRRSRVPTLMRGHGDLLEVVFLKKNHESLLVFADGLVFPLTKEDKKGDDKRQVIAHEVNTFSYIEQAGSSIGGGSRRCRR
jgi:hypothetical protein